MCWPIAAHEWMRGGTPRISLHKTLVKLSNTDVMVLLPGSIERRVQALKIVVV